MKTETSVDRFSLARAATTTPGTRRGLRLSGIRTRMMAGFLALMVLLLAVALLGARQILRYGLAEDVDQSLVQEVAEMRTLAAGTDSSTGMPLGTDPRALFDTYFASDVPGEHEAFLTLVDGRVYKRSAGAISTFTQRSDLVLRWAGSSRTEWGEVGSRAGPIRYVAVPVFVGDDQHGVFVAANFLRNERADIDHALNVAIRVSAAVLGLATLLAWAAAGRVLAPIRQATATAHSITETDLTRRIPVHGTDEIAVLSATFNEMLDRLETAFGSQRQFLNDAGHELRTPITIIQGHLELLGPDPEDQQQTIAVVTGELDRMNRFVTDLLLLAKAERPDFLRREPVDLAALAEDAWLSARAIAPRQWILEPGSSATVIADPDRLTQAVVNLVGNAVRYTDEDDEIAIGSAAGAGEFRLWVRDTGSGIAPADHARVFERFTRDTLRRADGTGLGLAIVKAIAEAHGGRIDLASTPGQGSTFTLVLPVHKEHP